MKRQSASAAGSVLLASALAPGVSTAETDRTVALPAHALAALCADLAGEPLNVGNERDRCYGGSDGWTSFIGHGMVSAANAARN